MEETCSSCFSRNLACGPKEYPAADPQQRNRQANNKLIIRADETHWVAAGMPDISHTKLIACGGYGEVHQVSPNLILDVDPFTNPVLNYHDYALTWP